MPGESRRIVVIGLGVGGLHAARSAMNQDRKARVTIIEQRPYDMFSPCSLPFVMDGTVKEMDEIKYSVPGHLARLEKLTSCRVDRVDHDNRTVYARNLETEEEFTREYDALVLATGAGPVVPPVPGAGDFFGKGMHFVTNPENTQALMDDAKGRKSAVVIGGSFIGLEVAWSLKRMGLDVHITKRTPPTLYNDLDPEMGDHVREYLESEGFHLHFGDGFDEVTGGDRLESVVIKGEKIPCDVAVMAVGMRAETTLAEATGVECGKNGIVTDEGMRTNLDGIFAVGDCAQTIDFFRKEPHNMLLATAAYKHGQIAGVNAAGGGAVYDGALDTLATHVGHLELAACGLTTEQAKAAGFDPVNGKAKSLTKPHYMPGSTGITIKVIADKATGKVLGGQGYGESGAAWRINVIGLAIKAGMTLRQLADAELAYTPPISETYDVLHMAAEFAMRRMRK